VLVGILTALERAERPVVPGALAAFGDARRLVASVNTPDELEAARRAL
jgi:hypothetical protein